MGSNPTLSASSIVSRSHRPTGTRERDGHAARPGPRTLLRMKAILQATFAAVLSGILVGVLLKNRVTVAVKR